MLQNAPFLLRTASAIHQTRAFLSPPPPWTMPSPPDLLPLCSSAQSLCQTQQAHASALLRGLLPRSVTLSAALILSYATFNRSEASRLLFGQNLLCRRATAFLCNTLIRALSIAGVRDRFETYNWMVRNGIRPDDHTLPFVLKVCADYRQTRKGLEVHGLVFKVGFDSDVFVANTLLLFYGICGNVTEVERVFDEMPERDAVTWNTFFGVLSVKGCFGKVMSSFPEMISMSGFKPNAVSVVTVLPVCAELEDGVFASEIHSYVVKVGMDCIVTVGNALIDAYGKCGNMEASKQVFDEMSDRTVVSWNAIITNLSHSGLGNHCFDMFRLMIREGTKPDAMTISSMLPVAVELDLIKRGKEIHGYTVRNGIEPDIFVSNSLIDMYAKSRHAVKASNVFCTINEKNVVSWNAMIANFAQNRHELEAVGLLAEMQMHGETPNSVTFTNVLPACARVGLLHQGKEIHARSIRTGSAFDLFVSNALIDMYAKCGCLNFAKSLFDISPKDEVTYNILIVGYSQTSDCIDSLGLFSEMMSVGMKHDIVSFMGVLSACANLPAIKQGKEIHGFLVRKMFHLHLFVANSLLDLYTKCGQIDFARKVFVQIQEKDVASWNIMILAYGMTGELETAIDLFEEMRTSGVEYDAVSYIAVLSACSHGGLVEKGRKYLKEMTGLNIRPTHMHYACMVDLLGRAGLLEEAAELIRGLPIVPDANIWGALLGACRTYNNVELGLWAAEHLLKLKPGHCGYYALLSNMYAETGRWDEANRVREVMKLLRVKKNPACSWVEILGKVHAFVAGDKIDELKSEVLLAELDIW